MGEFPEGTIHSHDPSQGDAQHLCRAQLVLGAQGAIGMGHGDIDWDMTWEFFVGIHPKTHRKHEGFLRTCCFF